MRSSIVLAFCAFATVIVPRVSGAQKGTPNESFCEVQPQDDMSCKRLRGTPCDPSSVSFNEIAVTLRDIYDDPCADLWVFADNVNACCQEFCQCEDYEEVIGAVTDGNGECTIYWPRNGVCHEPGGAFVAWWVWPLEWPISIRSYDIVVSTDLITDCEVLMGDFTEFSTQFGREGDDLDADYTGNCVVSLGDMTAFCTYFGCSCTPYKTREAK